MTLLSLGKVSQYKGSYNDALECYHQALEMEKKVHGNDVNEQDITATLYCLGKVAQYKGSYVDALNCYHQSLDMTSRIFGREANHRYISETLHKIKVRTMMR